ncbi:MAG: gliding motility-associated C-terminal domain-containing protein [Saprospiraceae bacterium]
MQPLYSIIQGRFSQLSAWMVVIFFLVNGSASAQITFDNAPLDEAVSCQYIPTAPTVTAQSTCAGAVTVNASEVRTDGACLFTFTLTRTWEASDNCGLVVTHIQTIAVSDTQAPIVAGVPANRTVDLSSVPPEPTPSAIDFCDPAATLTTQRDSISGPCGAYTIVYIYTARDACNNERVASYVLTVTDDELPVISGVQPGSRLDCGDPLPTAGSTGVTATDNSGTPALTMVIDTLDNLGGDTCRIVRRVWTAIDDCGGSVTAVQAFSYHDGDAPVLSGIPADAIVYCEALPTPPVLYTDITATDGCDPTPGITFTEVSEQTNNGTCSDMIYNVIRTWTAVDECGNEMSASQVLEMKCECCYNGIDDDDDGLVDDYDPQCNCFAGVETECDSMKRYFIPPVWRPNDGNLNQPSELVITTLEAEANIQVQTGDGTTYNQSFVIRKGNPLRIPLTTSQLQTDNYNQVENDKGWVIISDKLIQPIYRIDAFYNKALVTVKGPQAMGRVFRAGSQTSTCGTNDRNRYEGHFISVMATEDNTEVTFKFDFPALGGITGPYVRTLNAYETLLIRDDWDNTTVSGSLITSTKPIVVTSGSQHTKACEYLSGSQSTRVARGMDAGIDQLVPNCLTGDEYVLVRGKGHQSQQYAILVANKNNTRVIIDGDPNSEIVLNAGEHETYYLLGNRYEARHFKANKPFYMFHVSGISPNNEVGMAIAAPIGECKGDTLIEFPRFDGNTSKLVDNSVYVILPRTGLPSLEINGSNYSSCASVEPVPARPDLAVVTFEVGCIDQNNSITSDEYFTAGMLVGIEGETGTHGYLTAFKDRMTVYKPNTLEPTTQYFVDTLCGLQTINHCIDVTSCATTHTIASVRQGAGTITLTGGTCFNYTSPESFQGLDEALITVRNDQGLFQTVCLSFYVCATPPDAVFSFMDTTVVCDSIPPLEVPILTDDCDISIDYSHDDVIVDGACDYSYVINRNWYIWDDCGDSTLVTQVIRVTDNSAPQVLNIPSDTIVAGCVANVPIVHPTFVENCDSDYEWSFDQQTIDSTCIYNKTIVRTWEAWDGCGNRSTAVQRIELRDTASPILTGVPMDQIVTCGDGFPPPIVTATDDCDPSPLITLDSTVFTSLCDTLYHVVRIWTATDQCGGSTTASQRILVLDLQSPMIIDAPRDTTIACGNPMPAEVPTFEDDCTDPVPVYTVDSVATGACPIVNVIYRRWIATDDCGHDTSTEQIITVVDTTGPIFIPLPDTIFSSCLDSVVVIEPSIVEACNLALTFTDSMASGGNCTSERLLFRTYLAEDNCGRTAEYTQLYYFQDIVPPFWVQQPSDTTLQCDEAIPDPVNPNVVDACSALNPIDMVTHDSSRVCPATRWITRTYRVSDWCGNLSTFTQTITIIGCEPAIPALATAQAGCIGEDILLTASVDSGYTTPVYLWQFSIDSISWTDLGLPISQTSLTIPNATAAADGYYRVVVANNQADLSLPDCSSTSGPVFLEVLPSDATTSQIELCRGDTLFYLGDTLTVSLTRIDSFTNLHGCDSVATLELNVYPFVNWQLDTTLCFGESIDIFGQTYTQSGTYRDTLLTPYGCDTTLALTLTVLPNLLDTVSMWLCEGASVTFEGTSYSDTGTYTIPLISQIGCDSSRTLVLAKADTLRTLIEEGICPGESVNAAGETFTNAGNYIRTLVSSQGCDSIVDLRLTVYDTSTVIRNAHVCDGEEFWFGAQRLTTAGTYQQTFTSQYGCDSNVTLNLRVSPTFDQEIREELCEGEIYTNGGYSITQAGRWPMQFYTADGCDSIVNVTLIYRPTFNTEVDMIICDGDTYTLIDTVLTSPGTFVRSGLSMFGCDSVVTLHLSVKPLGSSRIDTTLCFGESLEVAGRTYAQSSLDTILLNDPLGCDSLVYVNVEVLNNPSQDTTAVICEGEFFETNGRLYSETGIYRDTSAATTGCDSVYTVILSVIPEIRDTLVQTICAGDSLEVGGTTIFTSGVYNFALTGMAGCDSNLLVDLTVLDTGYTEVTAQVCAGTVYTHAGIPFTAPGEFSIRLLTYDGCDSTIQLTVVHYLPTLETTDTLVCAGEEIQFAGQRITLAGTYYDSLTSQFGCDSVLALNVMYRPESSTRDTIHICEGQGVDIGSDYITQPGSYPITATNVHGCDSVNTTQLIVHGNTTMYDTLTACFDQEIVFAGETITETGTYVGEFTSVYGCDSTVVLTFYLVDEIRFALDDIRMCRGTTGQLQVRGYTGPVVWSPEEGLSCTNCLDPEVNIDYSTTYTASVVDCSGDTIQIVAEVIIDEPVDVSIVSARKIRLGERTTLKAVADNPMANVSWTERGVVLCDNCTEVEVHPLVTTTYEVEATTGQGCDDREQLTLIVEDDCSFGEVLVPNIVTPNGDGANDELEIRYEGIQDIVLLKIFNRWGEIVYETKNIDTYWDGTHRGMPVNPGVFMYYLEGHCLNNQPFTEQGNVTVVR